MGDLPGSYAIDSSQGYLRLIAGSQIINNELGEVKASWSEKTTVSVLVNLLVTPYEVLTIAIYVAIYLSYLIYEGILLRRNTNIV